MFLKDHRPSFSLTMSPLAHFYFNITNMFCVLTRLPIVPCILFVMMSSVLPSRLRPPRPGTGVYPSVCAYMSLWCVCELSSSNCRSARSARSNNVSINTWNQTHSWGCMNTGNECLRKDLGVRQHLHLPSINRVWKFLLTELPYFSIQVKC